ncbi:MAG: hypothetical protein R3212_12115 [Xanthomonadales bacterium]|nr:hypothetical protein [Xanthomonadales bacterium]
MNTPCNSTRAGTSLRLLLTMFLLAVPVLLFAQDEDGDASGQAQTPQTSSPFKITKKSEFGCAEVDEVRSGGLASHEITINPRRVERCLREKVGTRFHECKKLKIEEATADWHGIVTIATEEGPVKFWFEEHGENSAEAKRVMVWTWPDTDKKYMCAAITSRR